MKNYDRAMNHRSALLPRETKPRGLARFAPAILAMIGIVGGGKVCAQSPAAQSAGPAPLQRAVQPAESSPGPAVRVAGALPERATAPQAVQPATPAWPVEQPPNPAKVSWDGRDLVIEASNSSLREILHQVTASTITKVEGLNEDQRIFGSYGPGPLRNVLSQLLDGSGFNVLMMGGRSADSPLEVVLSPRPLPSAQTATSNQSRSNLRDDDADPPPNDHSTPHPPTDTNPFNLGGTPRDPDEMMQEILNRQHTADQQLQTPPGGGK